MRTWSTFVGLGLLALLVAATQSADAACGNVRSFSTSARSGYSYVYTPGFEYPVLGGYNNSSVSPALQGTFWHVGNADPAVGFGNDSGAFSALGEVPGGGWVYTPYGYGALISGAWSQGGANSLIDGCIDAPYEDGPAAQCMAIYLEDVDADGSSVFALLTAAADETGNYVFAREGNASITLASLPKAQLTNYLFLPGAPGPVVDLISPDLADLQSGFVLDTTGDCSEVGAGDPAGLIVGYRPCAVVVPRHAEAPAPGDPRFVCGDLYPLGGTAQIQVDCEPAVLVAPDLYLTYKLVFDGGLEAKSTAEVSTRIECYPILADPEPRTWRRDRPDQPGRVRQR